MGTVSSDRDPEAAAGGVSPGGVKTDDPTSQEVSINISADRSKTMPRYNPAELEPKWQKYWEEHKTFAAPRLPGPLKKYVLDMFPYPSGNGLHVGHPEGYTATDIVSRYQRMCGVSVMHPMGFDAFGLPAEQYAKKTGTHPRITTEKNIATFTRQLKMLGFSYDWERELATTDVEYFRWTQHIFLVLYDTWFDMERQKGRPIAELPIPPEVAAEGELAVEKYRDDHRLAYQLEAPVNWCPGLGTVLANEEVIDGRSERGDYPVYRTPMRQWMLRITAYGDRLANDLDELDWSEGIKLLQRNWIGRSEGGEVDFFIGFESDSTEHTTGNRQPSQTAFEHYMTERRVTGFPRKPGNDVLRIYTTRPDTLFGATYMVIAPEHPLVRRLTTAGQRSAVEAYCLAASKKSDLDRTELAKEKTGVFTGSYAINPVNGEPVPVWVADYVLAGYGTGAIMAVPAHDTRDFDFAKQFNLPIITVVDPGESMGQDRDDLLAHRKAFVADGTAIHSGKFSGLSTPEMKKSIVEFLTNGGAGRKAVNYKLRDWLFSRQHFWGEPFPLLHELGEDDKPNGRVRALKLEELPLDLPKGMAFDFKHDSPEPPLGAAPADWLYVTIDGKKYKRETNSMPQWAGSCWYYLRYLDPKNTKSLCDPEIEKAWMPVDLYVGGAEHAVLHLLYARFWHKVLFDRGYVTTKEPFHKLVNQGMILGEVEYTAFKNADGAWVSPAEAEKLGNEVTSLKCGREEVEKRGDSFVLKADPAIAVDARSFKMSKSRGNVVNPDEVVKNYGADSLRLYEMFMGPLEAVKPWNMEGVDGVRKFLDRFWRMIVDDRAETVVLSESVQEVEPTSDQNRVLHKTVQAVTRDFDAMSFNTAIARLMEAVNFFTKETVRPLSAMRQLVLLLSPMAPHITEELWQLLGGKTTLAYEPWPTFDEAHLKADTVEIPVQICGKVRAKITVAADLSKELLEATAKADPHIAALLEGKMIVKTVVVPGRMVNFVAK